MTILAPYWGRHHVSMVTLGGRRAAYIHIAYVFLPRDFLPFREQKGGIFIY